MQPLKSLKKNQVDFLFTDIDGTLTTRGKLSAAVYQVLEEISMTNIQIIPVTGRPAGWCDLIARFFPVQGVIGENGALYFSLSNGSFRRLYAQDDSLRLSHKTSLKAIELEILRRFPQLRVAADQSSRMFDLAIDFAEDVGPFPLAQAQQVQQVFYSHGAEAKISSIHVNGWFGEFNKASMVKTVCNQILNLNEDQILERCAFVGDSPNDEPLFEFFPLSFAVANIKSYVSSMQTLPAYVSEKEEGDGFIEICRHLRNCRRTENR